MSLFALFATFLCGATAHHPSWTDVCDMEPHDSVNFRLVFYQSESDVNCLLNTLEDVSNPFSPSYGDYLTTEEVRDMMSPEKSSRDYVCDWMSDRNMSCYDGGDYMSCVGNVSDVENVFDVDLKYYMSDDGVVVTRSSTDYTVPSDLTFLVEWIDGLSNHLFPLRTTKNTTSLPNSILYPADTGYFSREVAERLYSLGDALVTNGSSAAAVEFQDGGYTQSDVDATLKYNSLKPNKVTCNHGTNTGDDIETMLDMDMIVDLAGDVRLCFLNYPTWIYEFAVDLQNMSATTRPDVASISYGWSETDQCSIVDCGNMTAKQYIDRANVELAKLCVLGVTMTVSSGDAGAPGRTSEDCDTENPINPVFPGSSPYVLSVGATYVVRSKTQHKYQTELCKMFGCANGTKTKVVNFNDVGWTSGSGFSVYPSSTPNWQANQVNEYLTSGVFLPNESTWNKNGRGYPDVTANGHSCAVYNAMGADTFSGVDGTSCSAPVWAGILTLLNDYQTQQGRPKLGFVNPALYLMATGPQSPFTRPLGGNTHCTEYGCCGKEFGFQTPTRNQTTWDPVTGLGEPNVTLMKENLDFISTFRETVLNELLPVLLLGLGEMRF